MENQKLEKENSQQRVEMNPHWESKIRLDELKSFQMFLLRIDSKTFERREKIHYEDCYNVEKAFSLSTQADEIKFPAGRESRSGNTKTR